jgi:hypothetical protein
MKLYDYYEVKKEFNYIKRYFNGWNPDTGKPIDQDTEKYFNLKTLLVEKYCSKNIIKDEEGIIFYADENYDSIKIYDEIFNIGDKIASYWLSGIIKGTITEIKVYFSTVSWELEYEITIKRDDTGKLLTVENQILRIYVDMK